MSEIRSDAPSKTNPTGSAQPQTPPVRVQLSRAKGWRMPPNTRKVDRTTPYGNPFPIGEPGPLGRIAPDAEGAVGFFRAMLRDPELRAAAGYPVDLSPLRGWNLACWCGGPWCHVDPLLEEVNAPSSEAQPLGTAGEADVALTVQADSPSEPDQGEVEDLTTLARHLMRVGVETERLPWDVCQAKREREAELAVVSILSRSTTLGRTEDE